MPSRLTSMDPGSLSAAPSCSSLPHWCQRTPAHWCPPDLWTDGTITFKSPVALFGLSRWWNIDGKIEIFCLVLNVVWLKGLMRARAFPSPVTAKKCVSNCPPASTRLEQSRINSLLLSVFIHLAFLVVPSKFMWPDFSHSHLLEGLHNATSLKQKQAYFSQCRQSG